MNSLKSSDLILVKNAFREYYFKYNSLVETPARINEREFGFRSFQTGMIRHLSFEDIRQVHAALLRDTPFDFYSSNAFYKSPANPMQEKGWKGADLIFDIDAKDLGLPCQGLHSDALRHPVDPARLLHRGQGPAVRLPGVPSGGLRRTVDLRHALLERQGTGPGHGAESHVYHRDRLRVRTSLRQSFL